MHEKLLLQKVRSYHCNVSQVYFEKLSGDASKYYASFVLLENELRDVVKSGVYSRVTQFNGDGTEESTYIYQLPTEAFQVL